MVETDGVENPDAQANDYTAEITFDDGETNGVSETRPLAFNIDSVSTNTVVNLSTGESFNESTAIQDAIGATDTTNGDTLRAGAGTYDGPVTVDKNSLTLEGAGETESTITGNLIVDGNDNELRNLTVEGDVILNGDRNELTNVNVTGEVTGRVTTESTTAEGDVIVNGDGTTLDSVEADKIDVGDSVTGTSVFKLPLEYGSCGLG